MQARGAGGERDGKVSILETFLRGVAGGRAAGASGVRGGRGGAGGGVG